MPPAPAPFPAGSHGAGGAAAQEEARIRAILALAGLAPDERRLLSLVQIEGLSLADAAMRMGASHEAARKLYGRAASHLSKALRRGGAL